MDLSQSSYLQRADLEAEIIPSLYPFTNSISWLPTLLLDSVRSYLHPKLNVLKAQMLDFKALSIRQLFKTFSRVETYLSHHYKREDLQSEGFYLSTNAKMNILEDLIDVYLGYLYDRDLKTKVIQDLVLTVWNQSDVAQAMLDPQTVAEYVTLQARHYGINSQSCYFGRSRHLKVESVVEDEDEVMEEAPVSNNRKFVYTATTLRLLEQIA